MYETAFFLFTLGIFSNFVGETVGCQIQKAFSHTVFHKYIIIFAMIYFTTTFTNKKTESPFTHFKTSLIFFIFYILINRMNYQFSIVSLCLLGILYVIQQQINYEKSLIEDISNNTTNNVNKNQAIKEKTNTIERLTQLHKVITFLLVMIILLGFSFYFMKEKREHKNFSYITFLFGNVKCQHV